eukprot:6141125-Ditylum_brightwellii.AAC.1
MVSGNELSPATVWDISTAGKSTTDLIGNLPGFGTVWLYPYGIANILYLAKVADIFPVTYDSTNGQGFLVYKPDGSVRSFKKSKNWLFYFTTNA